MTLGQKIQRGRKESGLSQKELAEQLEVSRQAGSRWENDNGYPEMEKMIRLSQIYHMCLDYLAGNEQEQSHENVTHNGWYVSVEMTKSFLTYQKTIVKTTISQDIIYSGFISEEDLTMYYIGSENFFTSINNVVKP